MANVIGRRIINGRDVLVKGYIAVEQDNKVLTVGSRRKNGGMESNGNGDEFATLLRGANKEEFSF